MKRRREAGLAVKAAKCERRARLVTILDALLIGFLVGFSSGFLVAWGVLEVREAGR